MTNSYMRHFHAPGRVEIGGNHTDHQHGLVLAAAVDLKVRALVLNNYSKKIRLENKLFGSELIDLYALVPHLAEKRIPRRSLARGVIIWFLCYGHPVGGFDAEIYSDIPVGVGLSSSAAYSVLIGNILKALFGADISKTDIAHAGQLAEELYFDKPCGLMDQMVSSYGGLNIIDFKNPSTPTLSPVNADFPGYSICITNTGGSHADLIEDYASCTNEMKSVAAHFGKDVLRDVSADEFFDSIKDIRYLGDRAVLRAMHFFKENERVVKQAAALNNGDMCAFLNLVIESGRSSLALLQNIYSPTNPSSQGISLALALSEMILADRGAWRVHGGGFAGTILAFVPDDLKEVYQARMQSVFGENCCYFFDVCNNGGGERVDGFCSRRSRIHRNTCDS